MEKVLNSEFHGRAARESALWRPEFLLVAVLLTATAATSLSLGRLSLLTSGRIAQAQVRLSFLERHGSDFPTASGIDSMNMRKSDAASVVAEVRRAAEQNGVVVERLAVGSEEASAKEHASLLSLDVNASLPQSKLLSFLGSFKNFDFLCRVISLKIKPDRAQDDRLQLSLRLERVNLSAPPSLSAIRRAASDFKPHRQGRVGTSVRSIFKKPVESSGRTIQPVRVAGDDTGIKDLNLVGIITDGETRAVIEDKKASKTYYLVKDDEIAGMRVAEILQQEVILEKNGERTSLTL